MTVEGQWVDRIVGLEGVQNDIAMLRTPDGHGRLELIKFRDPIATTTELNAPVNTLGIRRIMFSVNGIDDITARLQKRGAELVGEMVQYGDTYRLCYLRGPEGIMVALAEELGNKSTADDKKSKKSALLRMDNVLIVVDDLEAARAFFFELGLELQGCPGHPCDDADSRWARWHRVGQIPHPQGDQVWSCGHAGEHAGYPSRYVRRR
jgi:catechol 2,3-dioxygenase-like lactoylglutathione lyase family enzyme